MSKHTQSPEARQLLQGHSCCELCGNKRNLEVHHIIPVVCGGSDCVDNLIVVCGVCHAKLTPKKELTKIGLQNARNRGVILGAKPGENNNGGRPQKEITPLFLDAYKLWRSGEISATEAIEKCQIPKATFYRMVKRYERANDR